MTLKNRIFRCSVCGNIEDRDINSANIVENRCTAGTAGIKACKSGLIDNRISEIFDQLRDMMKQEAPVF